MRNFTPEQQEFDKNMGQEMPDLRTEVDRAPKNRKVLHLQTWMSRSEPYMWDHAAPFGRGQFFLPVLRSTPV